MEQEISLETESKESTKPVENIKLELNQESPKNPVILSFDVGVIHLAYCLMTKKEFVKHDETSKLDWEILDWNNIDLTNRDEQKCHCGAKAKLSNVVEGIVKYYCKTHGKKVDTNVKEFEDCFKQCVDKKASKCEYQTANNICGKSAAFYRMGDDNDSPCYMCTTHAKQTHKSESKSSQLKSFKIKSSTTLNFDDVKYSLMMELENRPKLLEADYVVIENQPSFKNPRMKSIASTLYDYYLIRGIIDKSITKSNITQVKFMSPSNKLKLADEGDTKQLVKAKSTDDTKAYKLTKSLGIKYCLDLTNHLTPWQKHFNSHKKKDDLADAFLQGAYFYSNNIKEPKESKKTTNTLKINKTNQSIQFIQSTQSIDLTKEINDLKDEKQIEPMGKIITKTKSKKQSPKEIDV